MAMSEHRRNALAELRRDAEDLLQLLEKRMDTNPPASPADPDLMKSDSDLIKSGNLEPATLAQAVGQVASETKVEAVAARNEALADRYAQMAEEEEKAPAEAIPEATEREKAARELAMRAFLAARDMVAQGTLKAAGYRVVVKPIEAIVEMESVEREAAPTLAEAGFQVKTLAQQEREERGENHGIVINIGPIAFERHGGKAAWCDEGDVIVFNRYAGTRVEHPPGSKVFYQIMNDEDIFGRIV